MRIATDIGGTFTDLVALDERGNVCVVKGDTTPPDLERGVILALEESGINPASVTDFIHGATTVINTLTERKGAKTGLITTKGFRDVLEIARCNRPDLFNLVFAKPRPFVPRHLRFEVEERIAHDGTVVTPLNRDDIAKAAEALKREGAEAVAVCYINSYANDNHERETVKYIKELWDGVFVTASSEATREWREYERTSTAVLNAYVGPIASRYINNLEEKLNDAGVKTKKYFMQSNGGATSFAWAKTAPIRMVESGPAAGVFGAAVLGQIIGENRIIALDVGGTTAKCSLIDGGEVKITTDYRIERDDRNAGYPIMVPVVDIVEIGNGGGSIAWIDEAGSLRVGPKSAGALPGPVAYGSGGLEPTTTDACLVAGRLSADNFNNTPDIESVRNALLSRVGEPLGIDAEQAAVSVIRVAESNMYNALKLISVRRGYDPRDFTLVAFGGGGPMHAVALAEELGVGRVIIPVAAAVFSAWGMLMTDIRHDYIRTSINMLRETAAEDWNEMWGALIREAKSEFAAHGVADGAIAYTHYADMRYAGQEHTVKVQTPAPPWDDDAKAEITERFHTAHEHNFTYRLEGAAVEVVNLHLVAHGHMEKPELNKLETGRGDAKDALKEKRRVYFTGSGWLDANVYDRALLTAGATITGPAVIEEKAASALVGDGRTAMVDDYGNLIIDPAKGGR
jgi:N-methylhydantoinase A